MAIFGPSRPAGIQAEADPLALLKDGSNSMTGNLDVGNNAILNAASLQINDGVTGAPFNIFEGRDNVRVFQSTEAGADFITAHYSNDHDGTDTVATRWYATASAGPSADGNDKYMHVGTTGSLYFIQSLRTGTEQAPDGFLFNIASNTANNATQAGGFQIYASTKANNTSGDGGKIDIQAGDVLGSGSTGNGGTIDLIAGDARNNAQGDGGAVNITAGNAATAAGAGNGANVNVTPGTAAGSGTNGILNVVQGGAGFNWFPLFDVARVELQNAAQTVTAFVEPGYSANNVNIVGQDSNKGVFLELESFDKDATDWMGLCAYAKGNRLATDQEAFCFYYDPSGKYRIQSLTAGSGTAHPIQFDFGATVAGTIQADGDWDFNNNDLLNVASIVRNSNTNIACNTDGSLVLDGADFYYNSVGGASGLFIGSYPTGLTGNDNVGLGPTAGASLSSGYQNTVVGEASGSLLTTGNTNTCVGFQSGRTLSSGTQNVTLGHNALNNSLGSVTRVIAVGSNAGNGQSGNNNIWLGQYVGGATTGSNNIAIAGIGVAADFRGLTSLAASSELSFGSSLSPLVDSYFGEGAVSASPGNFSFNGTGARGTDVNAGSFVDLNGGKGTGTGTGSHIRLRTAPSGATGSTQNSLVTRLEITDSGEIGFFGTTPASQPATVSDPAGGATIDSEARTAINAIIDALQSLGLMA